MSEHEELAKRLARNAVHPQSDLNLAAAAIRDLQARLEQAEREKTALFEHKEAENQLLERQAADLRALLREAGEVVEPFASVVLPLNEWQAGWPDYVAFDTTMGSGRPALTIGSFRRARAFLAKLKENTDAR